MTIVTNILGCKVNYADVQAVVENVSMDPLIPVEIVGTCCVTAEGERQSRKEVRRAWRRVGPQGQVFVTGCAAKLNPASFTDIAENVVVVTGKPREVAAAVRRKLEGKEAPSAAALNRLREQEGHSGNNHNRTRFFLKIQDGCANMCSYCVVPLVRGRPRSLPATDVLETAVSKVAGGYRELVVCGINVGIWSNGSMSLPDLLRKLADLSGLRRLRLSSVEAMCITDDLLEVMATCSLIGRHLHIPLQSGDDKVLKSMGRQYDRAFFAEKVAAAREAIPGLNLTTDVIVGFPTEDEAAFANTINFVSKIGFSKVHVFPYSPRPGTKAAAWGNPVSAVEKKRRSLLMRQLSDRLGLAYRQRKVGQVSEVLLESQVRPGVYRGYSSDYTRFLVENGEIGKMVRVRAEVVRGKEIWGRLVCRRAPTAVGI